MERITHRQEKLLRILVNNADYMSASEISDKLQVSEKTVRNEIREIRRIAGENVITSFKGKGYIIADEHEAESFLRSAHSIPAKRQILILKHILGNRSSDFYELADQYYISESTLDKDIRDLNKTITSHFDDLKIQRNLNQVYLQGDETKKREITTHFLINEIKDYDFNFNNYISYFKHVNIVDLKEHVLRFIQEEKIVMTDIAIVSLILHLAIMIDRVKEKNFLERFVETKITPRDYDQCQKFCATIESYIGLELPETEVNYLMSIFASKVAVNDERYHEHQYLVDLVDQALKEIREFYQVDLTPDADLKQSLLIHLISLIQRADQNKYMRNPLIEEIREHFPLIYDMSVFLSLKIQEQLKIKLYEDEIGYLSLHLMCGVEKMSVMASKILLINPYGGPSSRYIIQRIHNKISPNIIVDTTSALESDAASLSSYSLVLSTFPFQTTSSVHVFQCSGFITDEEIETVRAIIFEEEKRRNTTHDGIELLFDKKLFFPKMRMENKDKIIAFLCQKLVDEGYANDQYIHAVMKREAIAPTAFGNDFAIPHPVAKQAYKSGIAVMTLAEPVEWGQQNVRIIFLFSLADDKQNISHLYEVLVSLLDNMDKIEELLQINDFDKFVESFLSA